MQLSDFRRQAAEKLPGEGHQYKVKGETKIDVKHNEALVAWTVDLDGAKTHGTCTMSNDSHVLKFTTTDKAGSKKAGGELEPIGRHDEA